MSEGGEGNIWRVLIPSWFQRGKREVDLTNVPVEKLQRAAEKGYRVDVTDSQTGKTRGFLHKIIVKGDDEE